MRKLGQWILAKNLHAASIAFLCALLPLVKLPGDFLASILVAFVTLRKGAKPGLVVLMWIALPGLALLFLGKLSLFDVLWVRCLLIWCLALVLRHTRSWLYVLYLMTVFGLLGVLFFHAWMADPISFWSAKLSVYVLEMSKLMSMSTESVSKNVALVAAFATGLMVLVVQVGLFIQLLLARYWQAHLFNLGGLKREILNIRTERIGAGVFLLALLLAFFKIALVIDMLPVLILPFAIAGISLVHLWVHCHKAWSIALFVLYALLFLVPYVGFLLALLGASDVWLDYRQRWHLSLN